jgi:hypothetical protein
MLVLALQVPPDTTLPQERWAQRALLFDPATGTAQPLDALDSLAARAAGILGAR